MTGASGTHAQRCRTGARHTEERDREQRNGARRPDGRVYARPRKQQRAARADTHAHTDGRRASQRIGASERRNGARFLGGEAPELGEEIFWAQKKIWREKIFERKKIFFSKRKNHKKKFLEFFSNQERESFWFLRPAV